MTLFVGIDPGEKTGVGVLLDKSESDESVAEFIEVPGGVDGFIEWLYSPVEDGEGDLHIDVLANATYLIVEKFTLRNQDFVANTTPLEIMGALKLLAYQQGWEIQWCTPAQHKGLIKDANIKRAGLYPPRGEVKGGHSTDGMRLICWFKVAKLRDRAFSELLFPKK